MSKRVRQNARCLKLFRKHTTATAALGTVLTRMRCAEGPGFGKEGGHGGQLNSPRNRCHSAHFIGRRRGPLVQGACDNQPGDDERGKPAEPEAVAIDPGCRLIAGTTVALTKPQPVAAVSASEQSAFQKWGHREPSLDLECEASDSTGDGPLAVSGADVPPEATHAVAIARVFRLTHPHILWDRADFISFARTYH